MKRLLICLMVLLFNTHCFAETLPDVVIEKTLALGETLKLVPPSDMREQYGSKLITLYGDCLSWWVNGSLYNQDVFTVETTKKSGQSGIYPYSYYEYKLTAKQGGDHLFKTRLCYRWKESSTNYVIQDIDITYKIHVPYVHNIEIPSNLSIHVGESNKLNAIVTDSDASYRLKWSSDNENVATVASDGTVIGVGDGTATIKCSANNGVFATCMVTVSSVKVTNIVLPSTNITLSKGETYELNPTIIPSNATNQQIIWSTSNDAIASVITTTIQPSPMNLGIETSSFILYHPTIKAVGKGTATITGVAADGSGVTVQCKVTVQEIPVTKITLSSSSVSIVQGSTYQLTPTIIPDNASNQEVSWSSSNTTVAKVNSSGVVTAIKEGNAIITCTAKDGSGVKATCQVTVNPILVSSITLNYSSCTIDDTNMLQLIASIKPSNANNKNVTWTSSNTSVVTVDSNGLVTAKGKGTATITCTAKDGSGVKATCNVTVNAIYVKSLSIDRESCALEEGEVSQLHAIIEPSNTTYYSLTWQSSNNSVATINESGYITAVNAGTATITCKLNMTEGSFFADPYEKTATCFVTVTKKKEILVTGITLSSNSVSLNIGSTYQLTPIAVPENATNKAVTWSSDNTTIATVNNSGLVSAINQGTATITCSAKDGSGVKATCQVTVTPIMVSSITLNQSSCTIEENNTFQLVAVISPSNASNTNLTWTSSNTSIATVDSKGLVTAKGEGIATITCTSNDGSGVKATCIMTVTKKVNPENNEPYAVYKDGVLTFYYDDQKGTREGTVYELNDEDHTPGWYNDHRTDITKVVFDDSFAGARPTSTLYWFAVRHNESSNLTEIIDIQNLNTSNVTSMGYMFYRCSGLTNLELNHFDTGNVTNMHSMFNGCSNLTSLDLSNFDTENVTSMGYMFDGCKNLTSIDLSHFDTGNVTDMRYMFYNCTGLKSLNLTHFDTKKTKDMVCMFRNCSSLTSLDLSQFNTTNVTNMGFMFSNCSSLTSLDVSHFDTNNVTNMGYMFNECSNLTSLDLSIFNTSNVTDMGWMFFGCSNLSTIYNNDTWTCSSSTNMFYKCSSLPGYNADHITVDYAKPIDLGGYFTRAENDPNGIIIFADAEVKRICVENWDTNADGELSYGEAAVVTDLGKVFNSSKITSFDELQYFTGLSEIEESAFIYSEIEHLILPGSINTIKRSAFNCCFNLTTIDFPYSMQEIENSAFFYAGLTHIVIPKTIVKIGSEPFFACPIESIIVDSENPYYDSRDNCHALIETASNRLIVGTVDAFIPNTVTIIGGGAFYGNPNRSRTSLEIPSSVVQIDRCILRGNTGMTSLHIPASVRIIDRKAFDGVENLSTITVDSENKYYDSRNNCNAIIETATNTLIRGSIDAIIPESVEKIESYAFYENNLTSVMIPEGVKSIGYESFAFCYKLKSIEIPNSVTSIGSYAFSYSPNVEIIKVHIKEPFALSEKCFSGFSGYSVKENATLYVPYGTKSLYEQTDGWKDFKNIIEMDGENSLYADDVTVRPGNKKTITLQLDNENTFIAGEFRLQLPAGLSIETDEDGDPIANLVSERINKHTLMVTDEGNGLYHFMFYSGQNRAIICNSGDFITLSIIADEELEEGSYVAELKNVIFSTEDEKQMNLPDFTFNINVFDYTPADVNGDGSLNVMDVVKLVNYIMGRNPSDFVFVASDMDENGKINVMDLVNVVEAIMAAPQYAPMINNNMPTFNNLELDRTDKNTVSLKVPDAGKHIAAQFLVTLSRNAVLKDVLSDDAHQSEITRMADGSYKVMVYSGRNESFRNDSPISLHLSGNCDVTIDDVVFVDTAEEPVTFERAMTNTTGIMAVGSDFSQPTDIYTVSGKLVKKNATSTRGLASGVYIVNNEKVIIK